MLPTLALIAFFPIVVLCFLALRPHRALIVTVVFGYLFLPEDVKLIFTGLPDLTKLTTISLAAILGVIIFDSRKILTFRPRLIDMPILVFCIGPFFTALANDFSWYVGVSQVNVQILNWGALYFLGRIYFIDLEKQKDLAYGVLVGALIYMPLCWLEMALSPQLHNWIYGYHASAFHMTNRFGGYRPVVFLKYGLSVGIFIASGALIAWCFWRSRTVRSIWDLPIGAIAILLIITTFLNRSLTAVLLFLMFLLSLLITQRFRTRVILNALICLPLLYAVNISFFGIGSTQAVTAVDAVIGQRAGSLKTRFVNQTRLADKAFERPLLGWGAFGASRVYGEQGQDITLYDGRWIIILGTQGTVGLIAYYFAFLLPAAIIVRKISPTIWMTPQVGPAISVVALVVMYMLDMCLNGYITPIFVLAAGALATLAHRLIQQPSDRNLHASAPPRLTKHSRS